MTTKTKIIRKPREPKLRLHKASGRMLATFSNPANVDAETDTGSIESWKVWLGPKSRDAERRFLVYRERWHLADYRRPHEEAPAGGFPVRELIDRYRAHLLERRGADWFGWNGCRFEVSLVPRLAIEGGGPVAATGAKAQAILRLLRCGTGGLLFREPDVVAREAVQALTKEIERAMKRAKVARAVDGLQRLARREGDAAARRLLRDRYHVLYFAKWTADDGITRTRLGTVRRVGATCRGDAHRRSSARRRRRAGADVD